MLRAVCLRKKRKTYEAHKSGTMKLQPFYDFAMDDLGDAFYEKLSGEKAFTLRGIGSYKNLKTTQAGLMFDGDSIHITPLVRHRRQVTGWV